MCKELTMSIHDFMNVQRGIIKYKDLEDYQNFLNSFETKPLSLEKACKLATIASVGGVVYTLLLKKVLAANLVDPNFLNSVPPPEVNQELLKEGFEIVVSGATEIIKFAYKVLNATIPYLKGGM